MPNWRALKGQLKKAKDEAVKMLGKDYTDALDKDFCEWATKQGYKGDLTKIPIRYVKKYMKKINPHNHTKGFGWWKDAKT